MSPKAFNPLYVVIPVVLLVLLACSDDDEQAQFVDTLHLPYESYVFRTRNNTSDNGPLGDSSRFLVSSGANGRINTITWDRWGLESDDGTIHNLAYQEVAEVLLQGPNELEMHISGTFEDHDIHVEMDKGLPVQITRTYTTDPLVVEYRYEYNDDSVLVSIEEWRSDLGFGGGLQRGFRHELHYKDGNLVSITGGDSGGNIHSRSTFTYESIKNPLFGRIGLLLPPYDQHIPTPLLLSSHVLKSSQVTLYFVNDSLVLEPTEYTSQVFDSELRLTTDTEFGLSGSTLEYIFKF